VSARKPLVMLQSPPSKFALWDLLTNGRPEWRTTRDARLFVTELIWEMTQPEYAKLCRRVRPKGPTDGQLARLDRLFAPPTKKELERDVGRDPHYLSMPRRRKK
jgi:hypothetical protein